MGFVHTSSPVCVADLKALEMKADIQARRAQNQLGVIVWQVSAAAASAAAASSAAIPLFPLSRFLAFTRLFFALVPFVHSFAHWTAE